MQIVTIDDLSRHVYGLLGIPLDATNIIEVIRKIEQAATERFPFLISTANINFLITSQSDQMFRTSLMLSDLCTADGMPIVWLAKLLGIPIASRVAGSDIFEALKHQYNLATRLKIFFFGGEESAAKTACERLNAESFRLKCVGSSYPGFGSVEEMSASSTIAIINDSSADLLAVALGAKKGQAWLCLNHDRLQVPIRVHLGAVINFQAGSIKRAPATMQRWGLEWLWRIGEEPHLWRRYWADGLGLIQLAFTRVIPLVAAAQWHAIAGGPQPLSVQTEETADLKSVTLNINGDATAVYVETAIPAFRKALDAGRDVVINCAGMQFVDARFIGLLLMLDKQLKRKHRRLTFMKVPRRIERILRLSGFEFLLRR